MSTDVEAAVERLRSAPDRDCHDCGNGLFYEDGDVAAVLAELDRLEDIVDQLTDWVNVDEYPPLTEYFAPLLAVEATKGKQKKPQSELPTFAEMRGMFSE